jgi:hypothetical protein
MQRFYNFTLAYILHKKYWEELTTNNKIKCTLCDIVLPDRHVSSYRNQDNWPAASPSKAHYLTLTSWITPNMYSFSQDLITSPYSITGNPGTLNSVWQGCNRSALASCRLRCYRILTTLMPHELDWEKHPRLAVCYPRTDYGKYHRSSFQEVTGSMAIKGELMRRQADGLRLLLYESSVRAIE